MFSFDKNPKLGKGSPKTVYNFMIGLFVGTFGCNFGINLLRADKRFRSHIFSITAFMEKNSKNMRDYQKKVEKLGVKRWDSFKPLFFELLGYIEEFGKDLHMVVEEFPIWGKKTNEAAYLITKHDSTFGKSSVLLATITVGGHFGVLLDLARLMLAYHDRIQYSIGVLIVPEDDQSTTIYQGVMWFLQHFRLFNAVIIWNNNNRNHPNSRVEIQDMLVALGLVVLLHRDAKRQPDVSAFDFVNAICKHKDGKTHFYGISAKATEIPRKPYKGLLFSQTRQDPASTSLEIEHTLNSVLHDKRYYLTGFKLKEGTPVHIGLVLNADWDTVVVPGIHNWRGNSMVNIKFLRANLEDIDKFPKILAVALREVEPSNFDCNQEFREFLQSYFEKIETTEEKFREEYGCPEVEETPETEKTDDVVKMSNFESEEEKS